MSILNAAIIGTGRMGDIHARGMLVRPNLFALKAACDVTQAALEQFGQKHGVSRLVSDWRRIVEDRSIDVIVNLLPHDLHEETTVAALEAGKHVLLEKPIARNLREADRMIEAAGKSGRKLMIAHNQRFHPPHIKIKDLLDEGALGEVFSARTDHHQDFLMGPSMAWWRSREATGGGCTIGSGIHRLDLLRWYLGEVAEVFAYTREDPSRLDAEVLSAAVLKFRSGAVAEFFCNWGVRRFPWCEGMSLFGRQGALYLYGPSLQLVSIPKGLTELTTISGDRPAPSMWDHFHRCCGTGEIPLTSAAESRKSLEVAVAIVKSAELGRPVQLPLA